MKKNLLLLCVIFTALFSSAQITPTDLFFSEYVEGSGNNKALEIYNPTNHNIDLSNYYVARYSNGNPTYAEGGLTHLSGTLTPYHTFILVNGQTVSLTNSPACSKVLQDLATITNFGQLDGAYPAPTYMNGNDAISLFKTPGGANPTATNITAVDLIGQIGLGSAITVETGWSYVKDSTLTYKNTTGTLVTGKVINYIVQAKATDGITYGPYWMAWTADHSLIRKPTIVKGVVINPVPFVVDLQWDTVAGKYDTATHHFVYKDIWENLGSHVSVADPNYGLAVNDLPAQSSLSIYPNPVNADRITIASLLPVKSVEIFSIIGQLVYTERFASPQKETKVFTGQLVKGIFFVKATFANNSNAVQRILVK